MVVIHVNKAIPEAEVGGSKKDPLHCTSGDFEKLPANTEGKLGEVQVRALAPETTYAEICLNSRGCNGEGTTEKETVADTHFGHGKGVDGLMRQVSDKVMA